MTKLQDLDAALLALVPAEKREAARLLMRLKTFTPYQHAVADAVEWCERRANESNDPPGKIIAEAATKFEVEEKSLDRGWIQRRWQELNELLRLRKNRLHEFMESNPNELNRNRVHRSTTPSQNLTGDSNG